MMKKIFICLLILGTLPALADGKTGSIVGVWKLEELVNYGVDGSVSKPFGEEPAGYFSYTPQGYLSIQIMRTPPLKPFTAPVSIEDRANAARAYLAYFGTYRVDYEDGIITHVVEGGLNPSYTNTERARPFTVKGDVLEIDIRLNDGRRAYRKLKRVETFMEEQ